MRPRDEHGRFLSVQDDETIEIIDAEVIEDPADDAPTREIALIEPPGELAISGEPDRDLDLMLFDEAMAQPEKIADYVTVIERLFPDTWGKQFDRECRFTYDPGLAQIRAKARMHHRRHSARLTQRSS